MQIENHAQPNNLKYDDLAAMHKLATNEEALINRLDINHKGFVTPDQLKAAEGDKSLTNSERHTAKMMLDTQQDLRYQRIGYLPSLDIADSRAELRDINGRPYPKEQAKDKSDKIYLSDVKSFDSSLTRERDAREAMSENKDIMVTHMMKKYATGEHGTKLTPSDVWSGVDTLSHKTNLSTSEKEELTILKFTQQQMREMYPKGPEPSDHSSAAHKAYINQLAKISLDVNDLSDNISYCAPENNGNDAIANTYGVMRGEAPLSGKPPAPRTGDAVGAPVANAGPDQPVEPLPPASTGPGAMKVGSGAAPDNGVVAPHKPKADNKPVDPRDMGQ